MANLPMKLIYEVAIWGSQEDRVGSWDVFGFVLHVSWQIPSRLK
jgi:hypothetical protein